MGLFLIKGILIGLLFGMPAGAVGAMTVQRTLNYGRKAGLLTGLGASAADCLYACIGAFGLTLISDFLLKHQSVIHILGGGLVLVMGIQLIFGKDAGEQKEFPASGGIPLFFSSFAVGITNPAAILTFLFAFSWFGISGQTQIAQGVGLVCGVFIGTYLWWTFLVVVTSMLKKRSKKRSLKKMNPIFGTILILFGLVVFIRTIIAS